jgi:pimeloyl-ACP methyl ester carboxylesterase
MFRSVLVNFKFAVFLFLSCRKEDHAAILKYFPKAEFHYIADAGHWLHAEKPQQFLEIFLDCIGKVPSKS